MISRPVLLAAILALGACATVEQAPPPPQAAPDPQIIALTKQLEQLRATIAAVDLRPTYQLAIPGDEHVD
jgi:hypothetical protein